MKSFWRILAYAKPYRLHVVFNVLFNLLAIVFSLVSLTLIIPVLQLIFGTAQAVAQPPVYAGDVVAFLKDSLYFEIGQRLQEVGQAEALFFVCLIVIAAFFLKNLFTYLALFAITPLRNGITKDLRLAVHQKILALPLSFFNEQRKGDIISRMTTDLKEIEWSILMTIEMFFRDPIMILASLIILVWMSPALTVFVFVLLPVVALLVTAIGKSLKRTSSRAQHQMGELMSQTEETVTGLKVIKAFNAEPLKHNLFKRTVTNYFRTMNSVMRKSDMASPLSETLGVAVMAVIIWYGGKLVLENNGFTAEAFIAYILFFYQILAPAKALSKASYHIQRGNASSERVLEILDATNHIQTPAAPASFNGFSDSLTFKGVSFSYDKLTGEDARPVLHSIELEIKKGMTVALVGQSGSGKTTITNLVPRFYDVQEGAVLMDGINIKDLPLQQLRAQLGMVTQESLLFNESVHYNIALGKPDATREEVIAAAKIANADIFIQGLENGYDTNIGDGGGKLSGGQRQRLSIARAVLKNPPILLLDEATSALDTESERLVQDALVKLMANRTSLVVAHRLSTVQHADLIVVMDQGHIAERGTHAELLAKQGIYKKLVDLQSFVSE
jgi:subfamily B ATP-binding cassette protein MsbA